MYLIIFFMDLENMSVRWVWSTMAILCFSSWRDPPFPTNSALYAMFHLVTIIYGIYFGRINEVIHLTYALQPTPL